MAILMEAIGIAVVGGLIALGIVWITKHTSVK